MDMGNGSYETATDCDDSTKSYAVPIIMTLIASVGLLANSVVIFIITVLKEYEKSVTNIYVLQLAIADFIFTFQVFFHANASLLGRWTYGLTWCKISEAIRMLNYYSSIIFLTVMSVDRYLAINLAMNQRARKFRTKMFACIVSAVVWIMSVVAVINVYIYANTHGCGCKIEFPGNVITDDYFDMLYGDGGAESSTGSGNGTLVEEEEPDFEGFTFSSADENILDENSPYCSYNIPGISSYFKYWLVGNFVMAFIVPLFIICGSYGLILRRIMKPMTVGSKSQKSNKTRKRVTRMVSALVSAFVICWLPYHSFNMARLNGAEYAEKTCENLTNFTLVLAYLNSAVNPFFYTFLASNFRKRWGSAVGKARRGLRQSILSHSGDYTPGTSTKGRRKSSLSISNAKNRDDVSVNSFVTKNTIVPMNNGIKEEKL